MVGQPDAKGTMSVKREHPRANQPSACTECGGVMKDRTISQEFEREGVRVSVSGVRALVCAQCGEVYFEPGGAQALVEAVEALFALARKNRQHRGTLVGTVS